MSVCKRKAPPPMTVKAFYVLISRVRKFGALRLLQHDKEALDNLAAKQHDEYLHAWVHGYDGRGRWQSALAAATLADIRRVRRAEEARRKEAKDREKAEKARAQKAQRDEDKVTRAAAAKAARKPSAKPPAAKRKAPFANPHTPTGKRQRVGDA